MQLSDIFKVALKDNEKNPTLLYHYTTKDVLPYFLDCRADLHLTHYGSLNDNNEFIEGLNYMLDAVVKSKVWTVAVANKFKARIKRIASGKVDALLSPWIMSFTTESDSLYQWISYTGDKGGYAIGFDCEALAKLVDNRRKKLNQKGKSKYFKSGEANLWLAPCHYGKKEAQKVLAEYIDNRRKYLEEYAKKPAGYNAKLAEVVFAFYASFVKHESFSNEREWRLVYTPFDKNWDNVGVIGGKPRIASGIGTDCDIPKLIKEIKCSPHGDFNILDGCARVLAKKAARRIKISASNSPYNGR